MQTLTIFSKEINWHHALARLSGYPVAAQLLCRVRATPLQSKFKVAQRHDNVKGTFTIDPAWQTRIPGQRFLLIDDVITWGIHCSIVQRFCWMLVRPK